MKYLVLSVILITAFSSLQFTPEKKMVRVKEEINLMTNFTQYYTYTSSGRIASLITSYADTVLYEHIENRIVMHNLRNAAIDTLELNSQNYVQAYKERYSVFDDNGFKIQESSFTGSYIWEISNGNISRYASAGDNANHKVSSEYFFYPDKENCLGNANKGQDFLGNDSKNLTREIVSIGGNNDTIMHATNYYEFDTLNRVTKKIIMIVYEKTKTKADSFAYVYY